VVTKNIFWSQKYAVVCAARRVKGMTVPSAARRKASSGARQPYFPLLVGGLIAAALIFALAPSRRQARQKIAVRDPPHVAADGPLQSRRRDCPDTSRYCDDACAGRPIPIVGTGCPIPRCLCAQTHPEVAPIAAASVAEAARAAASAAASVAAQAAPVAPPAVLAVDPNAAPMVPRAPAAQPLPEGSIYTLSASANDGSTIDLSALRGKVSLVINVASK